MHVCNSYTVTNHLHYAQGFTKWSDIGKKVPNERTGKQCRERWFNHLDPQLKKEPWSDEEDSMLIAAQRRLGNSWTRIAAEMPGRRWANWSQGLARFLLIGLWHSENEVKNRWYSAAIRNKHVSYQSNGPKRRLIDVIPAAGTVVAHHHISQWQ
jgi:hypothetical protein